VTTWLDEPEVTDELDAFASIPDWLAAGMSADRVRSSLERHVAELHEGSWQLVSCTPERLRAKGEEWLARYRLAVVDPDGEPRDLVAVGNLRGPSRAASGAEDGDDRPGGAFGDLDWRCWLPDLRLELQIAATDPALPALDDIIDPQAAGRLLQAVIREAGYDDAVITSCRPDVVRYKPGSRCTVVVHLSYENRGDGPLPPNPVVIKTHQGDKGQTAWTAMTALWRTPLARRGGPTLAEPLAYIPERRILVQGPIPEELTLKALAREAIADGSPAAIGHLRDELAKTGHALAALHSSGAAYGRTATFEEELAEVREVVGRLGTSVPGLEPGAAPLLATLEDLAARFPAGPAVPAHHDFRPAQVLLHQGDQGFIDFDGASMAEPALDLGRFRAKLRDIGVSVLAAAGQPLSGSPLADNLALMDSLCDHFLDAYRQDAGVSRDRVLLWETSDLFTAVLHAWTKVRLARLEPRLTVLRHQLATACFTEAVGSSATDRLR
jgi:Phosphotransferase enzyme family